MAFYVERDLCFCYSVSLFFRPAFDRVFFPRTYCSLYFFDWPFRETCGLLSATFQPRAVHVERERAVVIMHSNHSPRSWQWYKRFVCAVRLADH